jgi:meso-butanediol dehydrogenase/(S,S)-butanediol dehydrogenase/diacetyl reductase
MKEEPMNGGEFSEKVALVTGAGKGIGAAVAEALARSGAAVGLMDSDSASAEETEMQIHKAGGASMVVAGDVSRAADAEDAVRRVVERFGGLDVLANIAGVVRYGEVTDFSEDDWDFVLGVNLKGPYLMSKYAVPAMRARGGGAIVNAASVQAYSSQRSVAAYSASKGGLVSMTRTMALDHAPDGIRVNAVAPGSVRTPMLRWAAELFGGDDPEGAMNEWGQAHPIGRVIEPDEVAELVLFLAGPRASAITGATYLVDGGLTAGLPI